MKIREKYLINDFIICRYIFNSFSYCLIAQSGNYPAKKIYTSAPLQLAPAPAVHIKHNEAVTISLFFSSA